MNKIDLPKHFEINSGILNIGGVSAVELVQKFGTPLYVLDEGYVRKTCKDYVDALSRTKTDGMIVYAAKALMCKGICRIVASEGLGLDVVSGGELATALSVGFDASKIFFHGNNKSKEELELAVSSGVYAIVIDSLYEIALLDEVTKALGKRQNVLVRTNPGVEAHTHHYIQTAKVDSKFGFGIGDGKAIEAVRAITKTDNVDFVGLHCHIGSQIFEVAPFELAASKMIDFCASLSKELSVEVKDLNLGGGFGIQYIDEDKPLPAHEYIERVAKYALKCAKDNKIPMPRLVFEPGRSIVGPAGVTLYTIGAIKNIDNVRKYVAVDGGMFENARPALYQARYRALLANKADKMPSEEVTIAGKCCESGDILIKDICLPSVSSGDILAILATGAYNYSMASNYNRNPIPSMVVVNNGKSEYLIRPETYTDIMSRDV